MLNARLYRAALVPFAIVLGVCAFSLAGRPAQLVSTLTPDAFQGKRAFAEMRSLAARFPYRRAGSAGDTALADRLAGELRSLGGTAGAGFSVHVETFPGATIDGRRTLADVVAERPGSTSESPIVIVAHRDAAAPRSLAEMSGTAVLLELARVFASRETKRTIILVSTSGGSGGASGAARVADPSSAVWSHGEPDAAIVIGDVAAARLRRPAVVPYSDGFGSAPAALQRTVVAAVSQIAGYDPGSPTFTGQLAHLAFPLAVGEQGALQAAGVPAVLVQASGEQGPAPHEPVSQERLEGLGRSILSTIDALDSSPDVQGAAQTGLVMQGKTMPGWAVRLLGLTLLFAPAVAAVDAFARARRRRLAAGRATLWTLSCGLPFLACALFAYALGWLDILEVPGIPAPARSMPLDGAATTELAVLGLTFVLAWLLWGGLMARLRWERRPDRDVGGLGVVLVLVVVGAIVWLANPYAALLLAPAANILLVLSAAELRPGRILSLLAVALSALPLVLLIAFYADQLGLGPGTTAWTALLLVAGRHIGLGGALLWSAGLGSLVAAAWVAVDATPEPAPPAGGLPTEITIRGPLSYAGPGSLGGTESALRR
jgi:hypothetical protein